MSKIMELAQQYGVCVGETYGNPEDESRERSFAKLKSAVTEMEAENARLERELAGARMLIGKEATDSLENQALRAKLQAAEAKLAALEGQEPVAYQYQNTITGKWYQFEFIEDYWLARCPTRKLYRAAGATEPPAVNNHSNDVGAV